MDCHWLTSEPRDIVLRYDAYDPTGFRAKQPQEETAATIDDSLGKIFSDFVTTVTTSGGGRSVWEDVVDFLEDQVRQNTPLSSSTGTGGGGEERGYEVLLLWGTVCGVAGWRPASDWTDDPVCVPVHAAGGRVLGGELGGVRGAPALQRPRRHTGRGAAVGDEAPSSPSDRVAPIWLSEERSPSDESLLFFVVDV